MKKDVVKWTVTTAMAASITMAPAMANASSTDEEHNNSSKEYSPSEQSLEQYDEAFTEDSLVIEGAQGGYVIAIQQELNDRGIATNVDGIYGPQTKHSVELFQNSLNLQVDGMVGINTWNALNSDSSYPNMLIMEGQNNAYVSQVQQELDDRGIDTMIDGIYGPQTKANVMEYQERNQLYADGIVGPYTWDLMFPFQNSDENLDEKSSKEISSSEEAIEKVKNSEDFGEDIIFDDLGGELREDEQGSYYTVQLTSEELMEAGGTGTVDEFKVYQNGDYVSVYGDSEK